MYQTDSLVQSEAGRRALEERHIRAPLPMSVGSLCEHVVFLRKDQTNVFCEEGWRTIFSRLGLHKVDRQRDAVFGSSDDVTAKWESHTEFVTLTLVRKNATSAIPQNDIFHIVDKPIAFSTLLVAVGMDSSSSTKRGAFSWSKKANVVRSSVLGGRAEVESDFRVDASGNIRISVAVDDDDPARVGRLIQRLMEIETYATLSLMAWETITKAAPKLDETDQKLQLLIKTISEDIPNTDKAILTELTDLAAFHESEIARSRFRLDASLAYFAIVMERLEELNENRIEGSQRVSNFVKRRLVPASRTFRHVIRRQDQISERINRTTQLLRSRVDVELASQNQLQLEAMNYRAEAQFRLQKTVEGLSAIAISYYALGILSYLFALAGNLIPNFLPKEALGFAAPIVVLFVWFSLRRIR